MWWAKTVTVQQDGASPHTGDSTPAILKRSGSNPTVPGNCIIEMVTQSSNSPDTNTNDLGFFPSMSSRVNKCGQRNLSELVKFVDKEYWSYPEATLENIWAMKGRVLGAIIKAGGNNDFVMPHRKKH